MAKTLVVCKHEPGPMQNGRGGCSARASHQGMCPGIELAKWLNSLGDDDQLYSKLMDTKGDPITNGRVRDNWIRENDHITPREPRLAELRASERRLRAELRLVLKELKRIAA